MAHKARMDRPRADRLIGGVCAGLGNYLGIDPTVVRVCAVVAAVFWPRGDNCDLRRALVGDPKRQFVNC